MQSLSTKYRPNRLEDVVSQESVIKIIKRQVELNRISNVYLFAGPSGCGKTTLARIFANMINNGQGTPIEIDAASNNGVDNIRDIIKSAKERAIDSEYKCIILDECQMLSSNSWNALLKCIEEPPKYTIFMFATTDPQKIPPTILNRVMRFNLSRISSEDIYRRLLFICEQEGFLNYKDACDYISRTSNNQMRDAIATLDKCASYSNDLCISNVEKSLGTISYDTYFKLVNSIIDGKTDESLLTIQEIINSGCEVKFFVDSFLSFVVDICKYCICNTYKVTKFPSSLENKLKSSTNFENPSVYYCYLSDRLLELKNLIKTDTNQIDTVNVYCMRMCRGL